MFIGREHELKLLHDLWNKKRSILVACIGRRRIGKSTLIKEFAKHEQMHFIEFQGIAPTIDTTKATQLKHFSTQLSKQFQLPVLPLIDWYSAFDLLNSQIKTDTLLFIDEISWLAHGDSDFPGLLKNAWDNCFKMHKHLMIVMCGSVSTWIEENILNSTAFVGRISAKILLEELPINKAKYFWGSNKYKKSEVDYNPYLAEIEYPAHDYTLRVSQCGSITRKSFGRIFIGEPFAGQLLGVKEVDEGILQVQFMDYELGFFDHEEKKLKIGLNPFFIQK